MLRFLKRAAGNLQQSFKIVVPSRKLHLNDRRRILAKQLADFVHIYTKVTTRLLIFSVSTLCQFLVYMQNGNKYIVGLLRGVSQNTLQALPL